MEGIFPLVVSSLAVVSQGAAWADCQSETLDYEAARAGFSGEVKDIHQVEMPELEFAETETDWRLGGKSFAQDEIFGGLVKVSNSGARLHHDLTLMLRTLDDTVDSVFLRRRPLPTAITKGADLSRCLAALEKDESTQVTALIAKRSEAELISDEELLELEPDPETAAMSEEMRASGEELLAKAAEETDPEKAKQLTEMGALMVGVSDANNSLGVLQANPEAVENVTTTLDIILGLVVPLGILLGARSDERLALEDTVRTSFGKELDFGNWNWREELE